MAKQRPKRTTSDPWKEQSALIRRFLERRPLYDKLCNEVAYSLGHELKTANIEVAALTPRAKTLDSLLEKIERKRYANPMEDITDLAGVRVVHLYQSDFALIEDILDKHFEVVEKVDKLAEQGADRFGYAATHFLVKLGDGFSGARYDDLKTLTCELQVRTALQDAWAILSHHLMYKRESSIPPRLRREINSLAALLENADNQFEHIRRDRDEYVKELEEADEFLTQDVNAESVQVFLKKKFPDLEIGRPDIVDFFLMNLNHDRYPTIGDLDSAICRTKKARQKYNEVTDLPAYTAAAILDVALGFDDPGYRETGWGQNDIAIFNKYEDLVEERDA